MRSFYLTAALLLVAGCTELPGRMAVDLETPPAMGRRSVDRETPPTMSPEISGEVIYLGEETAPAMETVKDQRTPITEPPMSVGMQGQASDVENLNPEMLYDMGRQFIEGDGVERNQEVGEYYLALSAGAGNVEAKRVLAVLALRKNPSDAKALANLKEAAQSSAKAKAHYGMMLANLTDPKMNNPSLGMKYLQDADASGNGEASFALYLMEKGKDQAKAKAYLVRAAERGNTHAIKLLDSASASSSVNTGATQQSLK